MVDLVDPVRIVEAGPDDWETVRDVRLRALADSPEAFSARLANDRALPERTWRERLGAPNPTLLGLRDGHGVAMGGAFPTDPGVAMVWGMWTDPAHRGLGAGRRILDRLLEWSLDAGRTPYLHVAEGNEGARALYVSRGFVPTGQWLPLREGSPVMVEELVLSRG